MTPGRRALLLVLATLALGLVATGLARLRLDADVLNLLPGELPEVRGLRLHQRHFGSGRDLWITLSGPTPEAAAAAADDLADRLRTAPGLARRVVAETPLEPGSGEWVPLLAWLWLNQPEGGIDRLLARLEPAAATAALEDAATVLAESFSGDALIRAAADPLGISQLPDLPAGGGENPFRSADGTFRVIQVQPEPDLGSYSTTVAWMRRVRAVAEQVPDRSVRIRLTGGPAFTAEIAAGMEQDLTRSAAGTLLVVGFFFWLAHRSWRPLGRLLVLMPATLVLTLAAAGLAGVTLNVVSLGFAAILLGLVADYGLITWQERRNHPEAAAGDIFRRAAAPIGWSALTTAGAFAAVIAAGLPGLRQLGGLVAVGVLVGAVLMTVGFSRAAVPARRSGDTGPVVDGPARLAGTEGSVHRAWAGAAVLVLAGIGVLLYRGLPTMDASAAPLRPRGSEAHAALAEWAERTKQDPAGLIVVVPGASPETVSTVLDAVESTLRTARDTGRVASFRLPGSFWPNPAIQHANLERLRKGIDRLPALEAAARATGFQPAAMALARGVLKAWQEWPDAGTPDTPILPPASPGTAWLLDQMVARGPDGWVALGRIRMTPGSDPADLIRELAARGAWATSWERLGPALLERIAGRLPWLLGGAAALVLGTLAIAFRSLRAVLLSCLSLGLGALMLVAGMAAVGIRWNLMSLVALPLSLGLGVDYAIHVLMAARRGEAHGTAFRRGVGGALALCGATTIAGFTSLGFSGNAGLAALGWTCAASVACMLTMALFWLPAVAPGPRPPAAPSGLYRAPVWRAGLLLARALPHPLLVAAGRLLADLHRVLDPQRHRTVLTNIAPLCPDPASARRAARALYRNFSRKVVDLWRHEAGVPGAVRIRPGTGWEHFQSARQSGRGILLVTPHLGNWEFGTELLLQRGEEPLVITAREPGHGLTELRSAARAQRGTRTVVVGEDPFGFIPVIRHLQDGGIAALLVDRPAAAAAVTVEFLGRPFAVAVSPADMARATDCIVLPVAVLWEGTGYVADVLEPVPYDRQTLSDRNARTEFAGRILRAFEPVLRQHPDQWYHFVPLWP